MKARLIPSALIMSLFLGVSVMAEQPSQDEHQKKLEELKKSTDLANALAAAAEAKKKQLEAEKQLADVAKRPTSEQAEAAEQIAKAKTAKDLADADKAEADARKAASDAELAAFKAALGAVPDSGISGTVTTAEKAGELEAALLAMKAVKAAAQKVAARVPGGAGSAVVVMTPGETPTFQNLMAYDAQVAIIHSVLDDAKAAGTKFTGALEAVPVLGAAGVALESVTKLLSFFRSDINVKGIDVSIDDRAGVQEVANALAVRKLNVTLPTVYNPAALQAKAAFVIADAATLSSKRNELAPFIRAAAAKADELTKSLATAGESKPIVEKSLADVTALLASLKSASALVDAWFTGLSAADAKGVTAVVNVTREKVVAEALQKGALLLLVKVEKAGGAIVTKKNLWTFFGEMPIHHMGGAALSFTAIGGSDGLVKAAGVVPIHGGFVKAGNVAALLNGDEEQRINGEEEQKTAPQQEE
jgi:hypothetical protein